MDRIKARLFDEEQRITARGEARSKSSSVHFINIHLREYCGDKRTLSAVQSIQNKQPYKEPAFDDSRAVSEVMQASPPLRSTAGVSSDSPNLPSVSSTSAEPQYATTPQPPESRQGSIASDSPR